MESTRTFNEGRGDNHSGGESSEHNKIHVEKTTRFLIVTGKNTNHGTLLCAEFLLLNEISFTSLKHRAAICLKLSRIWQTNRRKKVNGTELKCSRQILCLLERSVRSPTHSCHSRPTPPREPHIKGALLELEAGIAHPQLDTHLCLWKPEGRRVNPNIGDPMTHKA